MSLIEQMAKRINELSEQITLEHVEFNGVNTYEEDYIANVTGKIIKPGKYYSVNVTMLFPIE